MTLAAERLRAGYGWRRVLDGVDLRVEPGALAAVVGPNGAGKSTLLRCLAGLLRPTFGRVTLGGVDIATLGRADVARLVAVVPQAVEVLFPFSVREIVALGRTPHLGLAGAMRAADRSAVARALAELELTDLADRAIDTLSGGERQRAVLAMALAQEADVLLLDEPTVHLDPAHQRATLGLIRRMARERRVAGLAVLHDLNLAAAMCDRIVVMADGRILAEGAPQEVISAATVASAFGPGLAVGTHAGVPFVLPER